MNAHEHARHELAKMDAAMRAYLAAKAEQHKAAVLARQAQVKS